MHTPAHLRLCGVWLVREILPFAAGFRSRRIKCATGRRPRTASIESIYSR